jgi:hypothetical protein
MCNHASPTTKFSRKGLQGHKYVGTQPNNYHPLDLVRMDLSFDFSFENKWNKSNGTKEVTQVRSKSTSKGVQTHTQLEDLINKN